MRIEMAHHLPKEEVARRLRTHLEDGLDPEEASRRLQELGANELKEKPRAGFLKLLAAQFNNFLVILLVAAAAVSLALGEAVDAAAIMAIVVLNATLGVVQESKAEQALAALKRMASPNATVIRGGRSLTVAARELVPGDLVLLEAGNFVPADLRLVESANLKIEEASLTGESVPVNKAAEVALDREAPLGDRKNSAFMGTTVTYGRGRGIVTSSGMHTQIGLIAEMLQSYEEEPTPLQQKLDQLARWLGMLTLGICAVIFVVGLLRDARLLDLLAVGPGDYLRANQRGIVELFMTAVSLAIAAVPEGLPAIVTICLALGMSFMIRRHALIRRLPAVETLGCTTVICSDKTGTLTQNAMNVVQVWTAGCATRVSGEGYTPRGEFRRDGRVVDPAAQPSLWLLLEGGLLCNDARLERSGESGGTTTWRLVGDPTEGALVAAAGKAFLWKSEQEAVLPRVAEIPFDSERKRMTTIHRVAQPAAGSPLPAGGGLLAFVKGAPDLLLERCDSVDWEGRILPLDEGRRRQILEANRAMAQEALRVLGVAYRRLPDLPDPLDPQAVERGLTFVGLAGMIDPARAEVKAAIRVAREAGIKTVMVTGDYRDTAVAVARQIDLLSEDGRVLTGAELEAMSDAALQQEADRIDALARVSPQHKVRIVDALRRRGHVVAMTGDGVNDAPALKRADIGVAMGINGTDVTKETADVVLTDDNYASIVAAVEQGRIIYSNIRKFVLYLLCCNVGEVLIIFLSMLLGWPIPLTPIMLLWLNLVTDGAPAVALGLEKGDADIMKRPPRPPREPVINTDMLLRIASIAAADIFAILVPYSIALSRFPGNLPAAQTVAFVTLVCSELLRAYTSRSEYESIFRHGLLSNRWMVLATVSSLLLLLLVVYVPPFPAIFGTSPLSPRDWLLILPFIFLSPLVSELLKVPLKRMSKARAGSLPVQVRGRASVGRESS